MRSGYPPHHLRGRPLWDLSCSRTPPWNIVDVRRLTRSNAKCAIRKNTYALLNSTRGSLLIDFPKGRSGSRSLGSQRSATSRSPACASLQNAFKTTASQLEIATRADNVAALEASKAGDPVAGDVGAAIERRLRPTGNGLPLPGRGRTWRTRPDLASRRQSDDRAGAQDVSDRPWQPGTCPPRYGDHVHRVHPALRRSPCIRVKRSHAARTRQAVRRLPHTRSPVINAETMGS
jgi:hypothetical protein